MEVQPTVASVAEMETSNDRDRDLDIIVPEPPIESNHTAPEEIIRAKIIATLKVYPVVSPSMLQAALGASLSPRIWKPTLDALITEGVINCWDQSPEDETPSVRQRPYPCLALATYKQ